MHNQGQSAQGANGLSKCQVQAARRCKRGESAVRSGDEHLCDKEVHDQLVHVLFPYLDGVQLALPLWQLDPPLVGGLQTSHASEKGVQMQQAANACVTDLAAPHREASR